MRVRFSLFSKIMFWFFLNLLLLGAIFFLVFNLSLRFDPRSSFLGATNRIESVARQISNEVDEKTREERDAILKKYSEQYNVEFFLFDDKGTQLAGREISLPPEVIVQMRDPENMKPPNAIAPKERQGGPPPPISGPPPSIYVKTKNPTRYWFGVRVITFEKDKPAPLRTRVLAASDSSTGHGLFFDPTPWLIMAGVIILVSILFWLPFVRSITKSIRQMTNATEQIAEEQFDVRVNEKRTDELGRLGSAVNHLAARLSKFVTGQKRFLGDVSHELNSPLARMQFALSILEDRVDGNNRVYVEDVKEEVQLMSKLVSELLAYSKAGMKTSQVSLENVRLHSLAQSVIERESKNEAEIHLEIDEDLEVSAQPELLSRAVANLVRNAVRYAGAAGPITVSAEKNGKYVSLSVCDRGAGVPESELEKLFDPFYRLETDRARNTGGTGLGLAIVKACVESCEGKVSAKNRTPNGLEVTILLKPATMK
jgi:two-component system sensor histidine kinase CpxA